MFFTDINMAREIIVNCYRKFKSHVYYATNLQYMLLKISEFEEDHEQMDQRFDRLSEMIFCEDVKIWNDLLNSVSFKVFPKISSATTHNSDAQMLSNYVDYTREIKIDKVNFFINASIEVLIIDTLWALLIGKLIAEKNILGEEVQANVFTKNIFNNQENDILNAIDFHNLSIYKPYFSGYKSWKNNAVFTIERLYDSGQDSTLISLDLTSYFYSVDFDFDILIKILSDNNDSRFSEFSFITNLIISLYKNYSSLIYTLREDVDENQTIIPIGLVSSGVLANVYLHEFDTAITSNEKISYYSRYVDDLIIVIPSAKNDDTLKSIIDNWFSNCLVFNEDNIKMKGYHFINIQNSKIKILKMFAAQSKTYISILKKEISNTSEPHLLPNLDIDLRNFLQRVHTHPTDTIKIRELDTLDVDKLSLMKFISSYLQLKKNTTSQKEIYQNKKRLSYYEKIDKETYEQLKLFFKGGNLFSVYAKWDRIFYFAILYNNDFQLANDIYDDILTTIKSFSFQYTNIKKRKQITVNNELKRSLKESLKISLSMAIALRYDIKLFRDIFKTKNDLLHCARLIQSANMFDNMLVEFPMINYYNPSIQCHITYSGLIYTEFRRRYDESVLNNFAIKFSPRFIHFQEYCISQNILGLAKINDGNFIPNVVNSYKEISQMFSSSINSLSMSVERTEVTKKENYIVSSVKVKSPSNFIPTDKSNIYIALANINLEKHELFKHGKFNFNQCTFERKSELYKLLNQAYIQSNNKYSIDFGRTGNMTFRKDENHSKEPVKFLAFPEVSIPVEWLDDVAKFVRKSGTAVICGVKHFLRGNRIYNCVATIVPVGNEQGRYHNAFVTLREKNDYSPDEISLMEFNHYEYNKSPVSYNCIFNWDDINFSVFDCFELTDINARAMMKSKLDILFAPEYNKDINYFSNIVESASRDIYCFVVQINTSHYGDTKIIAPYKSEIKCIANIKGGERDIIHIGKIDISEYIKYQDFEGSQEYKKWITQEKNEERKKKQDQFYEYKKYKKTSARHKQ